MEVFIISAARTAIGGFGGSLRDLSIAKIANPVMDHVVMQAGINKEDIDDIILGNAFDLQYGNVARVCALLGGYPHEVPGMTVDRTCTSSMEAVNIGALKIKAGQAEIILAGGVESMSTTPYLLPQLRWGSRMRSSKAIDILWDGMQDPIYGIGMGLTAEKLAEIHHISREEQDKVAFRSHKNASEATKEGRFKGEIVPLKVPIKGGETIFERDEHVREGISLEALSKLKPAFKENGTVTAGNACGMNDGAAMTILMSEKKVKELDVTPLARIVSYGAVAVDPTIMGWGPVPATRKALKRAGLEMDDIELIEINEAFAAQYIACEKGLGFEREIANVNGGGIALGHPIGATSARLITTLIYEMKRRKNRYGLATICGGGGLGSSIVIENLQ